MPGINTSTNRRLRLWTPGLKIYLPHWRFGRRRTRAWDEIFEENPVPIVSLKAPTNNDREFRWFAPFGPLMTVKSCTDLSHLCLKALHSIAHSSSKSYPNHPFVFLHRTTTIAGLFSSHVVQIRHGGIGQSERLILLVTGRTEDTA